MVQKSGCHQLRLVVHPIVYKVFFTSQVVIAGFLKPISLTLTLLRTIMLQRKSIGKETIVLEEW